MMTCFSNGMIPKASSSPSDSAPSLQENKAENNGGDITPSVQQCLAELISENNYLKQQLYQSQQRETVLKQQIDQHDSRFYHLPNATYTWRNVNGEFFLVDYNQAAQTLEGRSLQRGQTSQQLYPHPTSLTQGLQDCFSQQKKVQHEGWTFLRETNLKKYLVITSVFLAPEWVYVQISDLTQYQEKTLSLKTEKEALESILEGLGDGVVIVTPQGYIRFSNASFQKLLGRSAEQLYEYELGLPLSDGSTEIILHHANGETIIAQMQVKPITWEDNLAYLASFHNITQEKHAQKALQESEERFRLMADTAPVLIWMADKTGNFTFINRSWQEFSGKCLIDPVYYRWIDQIHPDDKSNCLDIYYRAIAEEKQFQVQFRLQSHDGSYRWLLNRGVPRWTQEGDCIGYIGSCVDITEQKELEAQLLEVTQAVKSSSEAIGILSVQGESQYHNPAFIALFGYDIADLNRIGGLKSVFAQSDHQHFLDLFSRVTESGKSGRGELTLHLSNGKKRQISLQADAITNKTEQIIGVVISATDITDYKQVEIELQKTNRRLISSVKQLATTNHDIALLGEMVELLQSCLCVEEFEQILQKRVPRLFKNVSGGLFILNHTTQLLEAIADWGTELNSDLVFSPDSCWGLRRNRSHWSDDSSYVCCQHCLASTESEKMGQISALSTSIMGESLCLPLTARGENLGLLYLYSPKKRQLTQAKRQFSLMVAENIAIALANLKLRDKLQQESIRDPLTQLYNRRYLEESLKQELSRSQRANKPLGVIMIDIDHFKQFNDQYSHAAGDIVLQAVGEFILSHIRESDIACRFGGEELTVILPEATLEQTKRRAEQLCSGLRSLQLNYRGQSLGTITASFGIASYPQQGKTASKLLHAADTALYQAKEQGRDRVMVADSVTDKVN